MKQLQKVSLFLVFLFASTLSASNEFIVESFKALPTDMSGTVYAKKDGNNEFCGLIKVKTGIKEDLDFSSSLKFNLFEKKKPGEYWVYVSPGERRLTLYAEGFTPKHYNIAEDIVSKRSYELLVRAKEEEKIPVVILTDPPDAEKWLDGELLGTGDNFQVVPGKYTLTVKKPSFHEYQADIVVNKENALFKDIKLTLIERTKLSILSKPIKADIYIDDMFAGRTNMEIFLIPGKYNLKLSKEGHIDKRQVLEVKELEAQTLELRLDRKKSSLEVSISPMDATCRLIENGEEIRSWTGANFLQNIPVGEYELICTCDGYKTEKRNIIIKEDEICSIVINLGEGNENITSKYQIEEVYVQGGRFRMGGDNVKLSSFYIGKYEVTQKLYREIMGTNPSNFKGDDLPVERVTWYNAVEFCNKLSEKAGLQKVYTISGENVTADFSKNGYRLPTEAEWEYAARSGGREDRKWSGTNSESGLKDYAWYSSNSGNKTHPVGTKKANDLGIYDMSGNVYEWCWDWYGSYSSTSQTNPTGPSTGSERVGRGGSCYGYSYGCRTAYRSRSTPSYSYSYLGFRLARNGD